MKIGIITGEFPPMPGGVGDFTRGLAEHISAHGHDVHILSRPGSYSANLDVGAVNGWGLGCLPAIRRWVQRLGLSIVNLQYQTAAYDMSPFIHFLPAAIGVPLITTFHDLRHPYLFPKAGALRDWIVLRLARKSAGVITTNQEDDQRLGRLPNRRLIPIGSSIPKTICNRDDLATQPGPARADDEAFILGHFGFVKEIKGLDYLLEAMARLRADGHDIRLQFIGGRRNIVDSSEDDTYLAGLDSRITYHGLDERVASTGYLPQHEVATRFGAVDLMVLPFTDGASFRRSSLIAAIHCGCAILTTEPLTPVHCFAHGKNLWLVPPRSAGALEKAILALMRDRAKLDQLRKGAAALSNRFDWDEIARETIAFFLAVI
jgi:glycosyltransferase involved in cell wall biosynthesis